jgi:hypothetical protein
MSGTWFAAFQVPDVVVNWKKMGDSSREGLMIFGSMALVTILIIMWAVFVRKKRRRTRESYQPAAAKIEAPPKRRKWRRRRRDHRPLNPTLAQTGGLPPVRTDEPTEPPR